MAKNICNCKDNNYRPGTSTFYLFNRFNTKFAPQNRNPRAFTLLQGQQSALNTNRTPACDSAAPWRVPLNHYRKVTSCDTEGVCKTNEKIIKDTPADSENCVSVACQRKNYAISRLVNNVGIRLGGSTDYKGFLQTSGKLYEQNAAGLLPENKDPSGINLYKIGSVNGTKKNIISDTSNNDLCKIGYIIPISTTNVRHYTNKIPTATKKYANFRHSTSSSVSSRSRIQLLKQNAILGGQMANKGYNCVNGQICSMYNNPGSNTKSIMGLSRIARCVPSRIKSGKLSCPPPLVLSYASLSANTRVEFTPTRWATFVVSFRHSGLLEVGSTIKLTFHRDIPYPPFWRTPPDVPGTDSSIYMYNSITSNPTDADNGTLTNLTTTTNGNGSGGIFTIIISGNTITDARADEHGGGYAVGDTVTISASQIPGASTDLVFTLNSNSVLSNGVLLTDIVPFAGPEWPPTHPGFELNSYANTGQPAILIESNGALLNISDHYITPWPESNTITFTLGATSRPHSNITIKIRDDDGINVSRNPNVVGVNTTWDLEVSGYHKLTNLPGFTTTPA